MLGTQVRKGTDKTSPAIGEVGPSAHKWHFRNSAMDRDMGASQLKNS